MGRGDYGGPCSYGGAINYASLLPDMVSAIVRHIRVLATPNSLHIGSANSDSLRRVF